MKKLVEYKVLLWDFDGVIVDSNMIREQGFIEVLKFYPADKVEKLIDFHRENGGLSRYVKFRFFFEDILQISLSQEELTRLTDEFSLIMKRNLSSEKLIIQDSLEFIKIYSKKIEMHIVSGSDQNELRGLCKHFNIANHFKSINGSPTHKDVLVERIMELGQLNKDDVCLIGDSINDLNAAKNNGINFAGYNNMQLFNDNYITSFNNLTDEKNC